MEDKKTIDPGDDSPAQDFIIEPASIFCCSRPFQLEQLLNLCCKQISPNEYACLTCDVEHGIQ